MMYSNLCLNSRETVPLRPILYGIFSSNDENIVAILMNIQGILSPFSPVIVQLFAEIFMFSKSVRFFYCKNIIRG